MRNDVPVLIESCSAYSFVSERLLNMKLLILYVLTFTIVCFSLKARVLVRGGYLVQVRLNGYSNPTGKCGYSNQCHSQSGPLYCCDNPSNTGECSGDERCDSYFKYCLRPFGDGQLNLPRCSSNQERATSLSNPDDGPVNFFQSTLLGLDNPQNLSGLTGAYNGVQLYIEVGDKDYEQRHQPDEVVDILLLNLSLAVAESLQQNHTGIYNLVTMDLTITVLCEGNFGGSDCTQCVPGITGPKCNTRNYCFGVNCSGRGYCKNNFNSESFTCICDNGYEGRLCENIDCSANNCNENGMCVDDISSPRCDCNPGFTGRVCEINIDNCVRVDCSGNGQCMDGVNSFQCTCYTGFTGELCQTNIDDCVGVNCSGNGQCVDGVNSFQCTCVPGFTGDLCQNIDRCVGVNCSGNGQCVDRVSNFTCECTPGFSGPLCSKPGTTLELDSVTVTSTSNDSRLLAGVLGGGISGALLLLIVILLLTASCTIALCWSRKSKMKDLDCARDQRLQEQVYDEVNKQLKNDHEFELKGNEAYSSTTHYIPTKYNVAYGQTTVQIST